MMVRIPSTDYRIRWDVGDMFVFRDKSYVVRSISAQFSGDNYSILPELVTV